MQELCLTSLQIEHIRNMDASAAMDRHRIAELESMVRRLTPSMGYGAPNAPAPPQQAHMMPRTPHGPPQLSLVPGAAPMNQAQVEAAPPTPTSHHHFAQPPSSAPEMNHFWTMQQQQQQQQAPPPPQGYAAAALTALPPVSSAPDYGMYSRERM